MQKFNLSIAEKMVDAGIKRAQEHGKPSSIAVVDSAGNLVCFKRSDEGKIGNINIAIDKAWTAVAFKNDTAFYKDVVKPENNLFGLQWTNNGRPVFIAGGLLIRLDGEIVGGIGASGGALEEDVACCQAGLKVFAELIKK